jgi:recombination protein RecT
MANAVAEVIEITEPRFKSIAPSWMNYDCEKGFAIQILKNNDYLMGAAMGHPGSFQQAITNVAAIGLSLNPAEKLAYLICRNVKTKDQNNRDIWQRRIFLEPSYMGLCKLATDSGSILWLQADIVYENDVFIYNGPGEKVTHTIKGDNEFTAIRGNIVGCYCTAKTKDGDFLVTRMPINEILTIRDRSEAWKKNQSGPWKTDFLEQIKKTVVRRAYKMLPKTNDKRLAEAVNLSNENEGFEPILTSPETNSFSDTEKQYFDQMISKGDSLGMYVFVQTTEEQMFINLYHSFVKGEKGKYQKLIDAMTAKGKTIFLDYLASIRSAIDNEDETGLIQYTSEVDNSTIELIKKELSLEQITFLDKHNGN